MMKDFEKEFVDVLSTKKRAKDLLEVHNVSHTLRKAILCIQLTKNGLSPFCDEIEKDDYLKEIKFNYLLIMKKVYHAQPVMVKLREDCAKVYDHL